MRNPPVVRNNHGVVQIRVRVDGIDHYINRIGKWTDPIARAKASAISAQIWSDYHQGVLDASLLSYQPAVEGQDVGLLDALRQKAERNRPSSSIHAYRVLQSYAKPIKRRSDVCP